MSREEEIKRASVHHLNQYDYSYEEGEHLDFYIKGFTEGANWADENPKSPWINAKCKLPTKGGHYLCMDENHYISTLAFSGDRWVNTRAFFDVSLDVVKYWMPIPNLPKE